MADPQHYGERLVTGEAVAVELRPAGVGSRGLAALLDFIIQLALGAGVLIIAVSAGGTFESAGAAATILVALVLLELGYPVGFETFWRGRTPGKAAMGLRVLRDDGGPIRFRHAFVRGLVGVVVDKPGLSSGVLALIPMLFSARAKRLGDLAAGTVVVQERVPSRVALPPSMPPELARWARELDLSALGDSLALEARHFLARASQLSPWVRDEMGARLVAQLTAAVGAPPPGTPGWAYLSAVLAERRRREIDRMAVSAPPPALPAPPGGTKSTAADAPTDGPFAPPV